MLVLTRRVGEEIVIDEDIHLTVISIRGSSVRLGIAAPPAIAVDRQEIREQRRRLVPAPAGFGEAVPVGAGGVPHD